MSDTPEPNTPGVLRQEGPHRVKVAPGANSALAPSVGVGTKRLRPAVGAAPTPVPMGEGAAPHLAANLRLRNPAGASTTEVQRLPGRAPVHGRFAPGEEPAEPRVRPAEPSALELRLAALAELNARTSRSVTAFEGQVTELTGQATALQSAPDASTPQAPSRSLRTLFKRRSS